MHGNSGYLVPLLDLIPGDSDEVLLGPDVWLLVETLADADVTLGQAALTRHQRQRHLFSRSSGSWKSHNQGTGSRQG